MNRGTQYNCRAIVCRLRDWRQKDVIIRNARRLKPTGLFVNENLAKETMEKREEQRPRMEEARRNWEISLLCFGQTDCEGQTCLIR